MIIRSSAVFPRLVLTLCVLPRQFSSAIVSLKFADGFLFTIHRSVLLRHAKLGILLDSSTNTIDFTGFSRIAGHALVSNLYHGHYELLKWRGPDVELVTLKARLEIYALARTVELANLEKQVKNEIKRNTGLLGIFAVIEAVKETCPTTIGNDTWFPRWINSHIKHAFKDPSRLKISQTADFNDESSVIKLIFGCMLETYTEMLALLGNQDRAANESDELGTPMSASSFEVGGGYEDFNGSRAIVEPEASDKGRELLRAAVADRKLPVWTLPLQIHLHDTSIPSPTAPGMKDDPDPCNVGEPPSDEQPFPEEEAEPFPESFPEPEPERAPEPIPEPGPEPAPERLWWAGAKKKTKVWSRLANFHSTPFFC